MKNEWQETYLTMGPLKVLLVDDEPDILEFLEYNLSKEGYEVRTTESGADAIGISDEFNPDLILLDVMMPEMDGIECCIRLRENPKLKNTVIAFLSARHEDYSQIAGLDAGADDYITKPIKPRVFIARVRALLRRQTDLNEQRINSELETGLVVDVDKYVVQYNGDTYNLPKKEFELMRLLFEEPGKVFTREEILNTVWGNEVVVGDRTIDVHIRKLREKFGSEMIHTVKGIGYKLIITDEN